MKTKLLYMMLFMSIFSIMFVSCSGDEAENDSISDSLEKKLVSYEWKLDGVTLVFNNNHSVFLEVPITNITTGTLYIQESRAIGTWTLQNNNLKFNWKAVVGIADINSIVPNDIYIEEDENHSFYFKQKSNDKRTYIDVGKAKTDFTTNDAIDKGVLGSWQRDFSVQDTNGKQNIVTITMEFLSDGQVRFIEDNILHINESSKYTTSSGLLLIDKFFGGNPESFFYSVDNGKMFFYSSDTAEIVMIWNHNM